MKATTISAEAAAKELYAQIRRGQLSSAEAAKQIAAFKEKTTQGQSEAPVCSRVAFAHNEPFLRDHTLGGKQIVIGVAHASLAVDDFFLRFPADSAVSLRQLTFIQPIEIGPAQQVETKVDREGAAGSEAFVVKFRMDGSGEWQDTARGHSRRFSGEFGRQDLAALKASAPQDIDPHAIYEAGEPYFKVGPTFRAIRQLFSGQGIALAGLDLTEALRASSRRHDLHPLIIYSAFTALVPLLESAGFREPFLPFGIKELDFRKGYSLDNAWVVVRLVRNTGEIVFFDAQVLTPHGDEVAVLRGASIKRLRAADAAVSTAPPALAPRVQVKAGKEQNAASAIRDYLAETLRLPPGGADWDRNLMELGLASAQLVELAGRIASEKGIELEPTLFFEYPTLRELAGYFHDNHLARFVEPARFSPEFTPPVPKPEPSPARLVLTAPSMPAREPAMVDGIAVIGMDGRFAGANNLDEFWENLRNQKELIAEVPQDHWDYRPWFDENPTALDKTYCKWGSFLEGVDRFDPSFFNISPDEARWLDPQVRLLLQSVHAAAENAGVINQLNGTATGVFIGICSNDYQDRIAELNLPVDPRRTGVGGSDTAANRVSYWLDLKGPSLVFNTACSSSLFALHYACQALRRGECEMAFVASANLLLSSRHYRHFSAIRALSPTGRCRPFDNAADGYVPGECVGAVLLKPLAQAIRDGDHIHAVIKGSAALHAGRAPALTAPSVSGQENVLLKAWEDAGIDPRTLSYVECHGTGTKLGDSVELAALRKALARFDAPDKCCGVGSVKANLGHTESAAGLAGLLKVILQMKHREIPAMPHFHQPNEYLRLEGSPVWVRSQAGSWEPKEGPLRAGVSAFGFSGSYAHVVVEEAPLAVHPNLENHFPSRQVAIVLSARTEDRLRSAARNLFQFLQDATSLNLEDIAYTLQVGREPMAERLAFGVGSVAELKECLSSYAETGTVSASVYRGGQKSGNAALSQLATDEDMAGTFQAWFQKGRLDRLLELWVQGCDIDWHTLHGHIHPARIALPTYPFAPERFWIPETGAPEAAAQSAAERTASPALAAEAWQFTLVAEDEARLGDELAPALKSELIVRQAVATQMQCPLEAIRADSSFLELPLGSLGLVETLQAVGRLLDEPLSPALFFEHASVSAFATHLAREYSPKINRVRAAQISAPAPRSALEATVDSICPLSEGQKGLWALQKAAPAMAAYNCPLGFRVSGPLDIPCFQKAFGFLLQWQPLLASRIVLHRGTPGFVVQPADSVKVRTFDARGWNERQVQDWLKQEIKAPFDLDQDALLRAALLLTSENETVVLFTVHHIVFDGSSFALFMQGLLEAYRALRMGQQPELPPQAANYGDYVNLERSRLEGVDGARRLAFWKDQLSGERLPLEIPLDFPRSHARPFAGQTVSFTVASELARRLRLFGKEHGLYESSVFLAIFQELLSLYSHQTDIVVGMPVNERAGERFQSLIGYFVNMVPIRSREIGGQPFVDFARLVQQTLLAALANRYPFPALVRELKMSGQGAHPVFQAAFEFQNFLRPDEAEAVNRAMVQAFPITWIEGLHQEGEYELALEVIEQADGFQLNLKFNPTLLSEGTAARMASQLGRLLESALSQPRRLPEAGQLLTPAERHTLLVEWNDTACDYPKDACMHHFFEAQARKTPQAVAAIFGNEMLTYRELDRCSTQLALQLQQLGVQPDAIVGLFLERSLEMIVAILGVLKAGGAYMPLDPDYPEERLAFMVGDSKTSCILTQSHLASKVTPLQSKTTRVLYLDKKERSDGARGNLQRALKRDVQARHLAYVLYTSGSTGVSKGVMVEHQALCNRILWMQREYGLTKADRVLQKTPFSFDVSGWEFHWPLMVGARLVFAAPGKHKDPEYLRDLIQTQAITVLHFVPSMLQAFLSVDRVNECGSLRNVFCSGEELTSVQAERFFERFHKTSLHNLYGPTEAAIDVTSKQCARGARITIGKPIANVRLYVVDPQLRLLPAGLPGELCLAGDALARGYLNRQELTAEKFVDNPFETGARLYRTGDLARWTPEGEIQFLGRLDHQVKIRGCRIELGEIEAALQALEGVRDAVVVPRAGGEGLKLAAYYVAAGPAIHLKWLRQQLKVRLPEHMIPSEFIALDCLPLTPSGKVDRRSLSQRPSRAVDLDSSAEAETPTQSRLKALWQKALALEKIGLEDSFFDLGGHSLSALSLMAKVNAEFKTHLPLATLFEAKTVAELAVRIEAGAAPEASSYLVTLEARGNRPPLYLVPGIGGGASSFLPLSRALRSEQPVYAFHPPGRLGECAPLASIQELAAFYLEQLPLSVAGTGFCLGGWSMGGVIAYEMACQLAQQGKPVDRLILIDSYLPEHFESFSQIAGNYSFHLTAGNRSPEPEFEAGNYAQNIAEVLAAHRRALANYRATQIFPGEVTYFYATKHAGHPGTPSAKRISARLMKETQVIWKKFLPLMTAGFVLVPGTHDSILQAPAVLSVASHILAVDKQPLPARSAKRRGKPGGRAWGRS